MLALIFHSAVYSVAGLVSSRARARAAIIISPGRFCPQPVLSSSFERPVADLSHSLARRDITFSVGDARERVYI